jgi:hypothetical protein
VKEINEYRRSVRQIFYPQGDTRKIAQHIFDREIHGACLYGVVVAMQEVLKKSEGATKEELLGEMQIMMVDCYSQIREKLKIRIPELSIDELLRQHEN